MDSMKNVNKSKLRWDKIVRIMSVKEEELGTKNKRNQSFFQMRSGMRRKSSISDEKLTEILREKLVCWAQDMI